MKEQKNEDKMMISVKRASDGFKMCIPVSAFKRYKNDYLLDDKEKKEFAKPQRATRKPRTPAKTDK